MIAPPDWTMLGKKPLFNTDVRFHGGNLQMPETKKTSPSKTRPAGKKPPSAALPAEPMEAADTVAVQTKKAKAATKNMTSKKPSSTESFSYAGIEPYKEKKGEEYMNDSQVAHFRLILKAWKRELMEEVDRTLHYMQDEAANFPDPNDRASQESDFTMELRTRDRERKLIKKIDEALAALDAGEYGYCEGCGIEIGIRRLEARPTATLCIDCKTLDEIKEKQRSA